MVEEAVDKDLSKDLPTRVTFPKSPEETKEVSGEDPMLEEIADILFSYTIRADKAAIKVMPVNRVGDFGLAPGISGRFTLFQTVDFSTINSWISYNIRFNAITLICILLLIGVVGKPVV